MSKKKVPIRYTSREFDSIRSDLINYAKRYYPDTYKDFSQASFGSLMIDTVSYVGDMLSFYLDYQVNETFLDSSVEFDNILRIAKQHGYKYQGSASTTGKVTFYALIPANSTGLGPDTRYFPILKKNSLVGSSAGSSFILLEDVRFDDPRNYIVAARVDESTGLPTHYAVKAYGDVISGKFDVQTVKIGAFEKFRKVVLGGNDIVEIISVFDSDGHEYFEVDYLSHDVIYKSVPNRDSNTRDNAPSLIRPFTAPRRFTVERNERNVILQFGFGSDSEIASPTLAEPSNVVLQRHAKNYVTDVSFDPSDLLGTDKLGIGPSDTDLTVRLRKNTSDNANVAVGGIKSLVRPLVEFNSPELATTSTANDVISSIECHNEEPINGSTAPPSIEEVRRRTLNYFPTQNRAVTSSDYEALSYAMPPEFGSLKRCHLVRDQDSLKRNLNMYVLAEGTDGFLTTANAALKQNLKEWLNRYRMVNDTIDILDAKVVNLGIEFTVLSEGGFNKFDVLESASTALQQKLTRSMFIGERFSITDIYSILNSARGVADVSSVKVVNKRGGRYSSTGFNVSLHTSADGRYVSTPDNVAFEIRYPKTDFKGTVK